MMKKLDKKNVELENRL